ncbi:ABC transporter ATP-binding protein [Marivita sp.]|uniref:ABC transporter ATP-binding protein n=1 Tax=Marivita sp. TaxID=2003365 RepID=UPI00261FF1F7|nr:ABC transporter ATP-binding protein [Marivita sp.]
MSSVEVRNLSKKYGDFTAVRNASFRAETGSLISILGPSGCGKTTTLRTIAGFEDATAGDILLDERSVSDVPAWRRNIGIVFQSYALFPFMTVADNVGYGLKMRKMGKAEIVRKTNDVLNRVGLPDSNAKYPRQLSGGQRQRVALARALVIEPAVMLLDEPLSALDAKLRDEMRFELKKIQRQSGVTTLLVTHDQEEAFTLSDQIVVMNNAVIKQIGSPRDIWDNPNCAFVADFIGIENILPAERTETGVRIAGREFQAETDVSSGRDVMAAFRSSDLELAIDEPGHFAGLIVGEAYTGSDNVYQVQSDLSRAPIILKTEKSLRLSGNISLKLPADRIKILERD